MMPAPDAFTRWALEHAIPKEHWHLCQAAWDAGAHSRQLTIAGHLSPDRDHERWMRHAPYPDDPHERHS